MNRPRITRMISPIDAPKLTKKKNRCKGDRTPFIFAAIRSCRFRRMVSSSFRSCSSHFSLSPSRSIVLAPLNLLDATEFLLHLVLKSAYLGRDVRFRDAHDVRDFLVGVPVQVK